MTLTTTNLNVAAPGNHVEFIPTNSAPLMSPTSDAYQCFVFRRFSYALQAYMTSYVLAVNTYYSMYSGFHSE